MAKLSFLEFASSTLKSSPLLKNVEAAKKKARPKDPVVINFLEILDFYKDALHCGAGCDHPFLVLQRVWKCHEGQKTLYGRFGFAVAGLHHQFPDDSPEHGGCEPACA